MKTYGDPIEGLDLFQTSSLWYPSWFTIKRILFCFTTLYLWDKPLFLLFVRAILFFVSFLLITSFNVFETPFDTRLELMNLTFAILLIDVMILFTGLLNQGNPDDKNFGSVRNYKISEDMTDTFYVLIFSLGITIHLIILLKGIIRGIKLICKRTYVLSTW